VEGSGRGTPSKVNHRDKEGTKNIVSKGLWQEERHKRRGLPRKGGKLAKVGDAGHAKWARLDLFSEHLKGERTDAGCKSSKNL